MAETGSLIESLPCGGQLRAGSKSWAIHYTFAGPDRRFKRIFLSIPGREIPEYIQALRENWSEMERVKAKLPEGSEYAQAGAKGMVIHVGRAMDGIFIWPNRKAIASIGQLESVIRSYEYACSRAKVLQASVASL